MTEPRRPELLSVGAHADRRPLPPRDWRRLCCGAAAPLCWLYLLGVLAIWFVIELAGDRWWVATMLLFGPRWALLLPLLVLVPLCIAVRRRWIWFLFGTAFLVAVPIMDLRITRRGLFPEDRTATTVRVLTLNTHFKAVDPIALKKVIDQLKPDIVALQEWYPGNRKRVFADASWHTIQQPEALLASPYPISLDRALPRTSQIVSGYTYVYSVHLPARSVSFFSVHLSSPHSVIQDVLHLSRFGPRRLAVNSRNRLHEATTISELIDDNTLLSGDFNLPRDSTIFRSVFSGVRDAFTDAGLGYGLTFYSRWTAVRIDHVLMGKNWRCQHCWVGPDVGAPHRPVIADLQWNVAAH